MRFAFRKSSIPIYAALVFIHVAASNVAAADEALSLTGAPPENTTKYYFPSTKAPNFASAGQAMESLGYLSLSEPQPLSETLAGLTRTPQDESPLTSFGLGREFVFNSGFVFDSGLNYRLGEGFRTGVELAYRKDDFNKFKLGGYGLSVAADMGGGASTVKLQANGFYNLSAGGKLKPFLGAGVGVANTYLDKNGRLTEASDKVLAYKFATGFDFSFNQQLSLKGEYEFFTNADKSYNAMGGEYQGHSVGLGLNFNF